MQTVSWRGGNFQDDDQVDKHPLTDSQKSEYLSGLFWIGSTQKTNSLETYLVELKLQENPIFAGFMLGTRYSKLVVDQSIMFLLLPTFL
jgi:hypothetical protein